MQRDSPSRCCSRCGWRRWRYTSPSWHLGWRCFSCPMQVRCHRPWRTSARVKTKFKRACNSASVPMSSESSHRCHCRTMRSKMEKHPLFQTKCDTAGPHVTQAPKRRRGLHKTSEQRPASFIRQWQRIAEVAELSARPGASQPLEHVRSSKYSDHCWRVSILACGLAYDSTHD